MSHKFCVAPMMDWTDRHCRFLHRSLTRHALLYTEMVTADAILRGNREKLLGFDRREDPVALQLGGSDPVKLAEAARIGEDFGYNEINLNVGCPSDRVQSGRFGACLMREPELVGECVSAMRASVSIPVTVKCRIGVDDQDPEKALRDLRVGVEMLEHGKPGEAVYTLTRASDGAIVFDAAIELPRPRVRGSLEFAALEDEILSEVLRTVAPR